MSEMEIEYFRRLFRYDQWANNEVLTALSVTKEPSVKALRWMAHLAGAGSTWLSRAKGAQSPLAIWPELTLPQCQGYLEALGVEWLLYLDALDANGLKENVVYRNSKGDEVSAAVTDLLTQVLTHGAYHRGQIAAEMRAQGDTPASTDFIVAVWKDALEG
jgi:uncharacterized damage-inducible protein DinB